MSTPNWAPAEQYVPHHLLTELMWMGTERVGGRQIEQYKHDWTRRYINLDERGQAWDIAVHPRTGEVNGRRIPLATALDQLGGESR